jgi:hypothetical protein
MAMSNTKLALPAVGAALRPATTDQKAAGKAAPKPTSSGRANAGNTHIAGEMFVAAELAKRGYSVSLTMGNAKAVDLFAEYKGKSICIQVKAIARKKNVGLPLPFNKKKIIDHVLHVCIVLNEVNEAPTYYILPPHEVRQRGKWYATRAILDLGMVRNSEFLGAWHLIDKSLQKTHLSGCCNWVPPQSAWVFLNLCGGSSCRSGPSC